MFRPNRVPKSESSGVADVEEKLVISSSCRVFIISMACSDTLIGFFSSDKGVVDEVGTVTVLSVGGWVTPVDGLGEAVVEVAPSKRVAIVGIVGV